jgi:hypothetical protein
MPIGQKYSIYLKNSKGNRTFKSKVLNKKIGILKC